MWAENLVENGRQAHPCLCEGIPPGYSWLKSPCEGENVKRTSVARVFRSSLCTRTKFT
jgi:hypothetical protein